MTRLNAGLFLVGIATIAIVCNFFAARPWLRLTIDATKTRAYSLSEQSRRLLAGLEGEWRIVILAGTDTVDRATLRQIDEVLTRYGQESKKISTLRVDPTDPRMLKEFDAVLEALQASYRQEVAVYERALEAAGESVASYAVFLEKQTGALAALKRTLSADDPARAVIDQTLGGLQLSIRAVAEVVSQWKEAMTVDESRPLADYETARSVLAAALGAWAQELHEIGQILRQWRGDASVDAALRRFASERQDEYQRRVEDLLISADTLKRLEVLALAEIGRSLRSGEAGLVMGPSAAAVIPSEKLFARFGLQQGDSGEIAIDQRFRGEQVISAAIRSLLVEHMPMVVFVHAEPESMLRRRPQFVDVVGVANMLEASRLTVTQWSVGLSERPVPQAGQPVVWVVVPPPILQRQTPGLSDAEQALIKAVGDLIDDGEPVLLSYSASLGPLIGRSDPWPRLAARFGLQVDTSRVIVERVRDAQGETRIQRSLQLTEFEPGHPLAEAVHGLPTSFDLPVVIRPVPDLPADLSHTVIAVVAAADNRWLEEKWTNPATIEHGTADERFDEPLPIVVAAERSHPFQPGRRQRCLVVGSAGWLLSYVADRVVPAGGQRSVFLNPGNHELLLGAVTWLAGADEMIAKSPVSRQVARLDGITPAVRRWWQWITVAFMPVACLAAGLVVWLIRRV